MPVTCLPGKGGKSPAQARGPRSTTGKLVRAQDPGATVVPFGHQSLPWVSHTHPDGWMWPWVPPTDPVGDRSVLTAKHLPAGTLYLPGNAQGGEDRAGPASLEGLASH